MKRAKRNKGLAFKLISFIFSSVAIVFSLIFLDNYQVSKNMVKKNLKLNAENLTSNAVLKVERILNSVQKVPDNFSKIIEDANLTEEEINRILQQEVENNTEIYGAALAFEPYYFNPAVKYYSPYCCKGKNGIEFKNIGNEQYDYFSMDWYRVPKELKRPAWCEPYFDEGAGNVIMSTYSVPVYHKKNGKRCFIGILTADISLDWLRDYFDSIKVYQTGYVYMVSKNGTFISHPNKELIMNETIFTIADEKKSSELREIGKGMIQGKTSFAEMEYYNVKTGKRSWIAYAPVTLNGWSVGIVFPVDELMADVNNLFMRVMLLGIGGLLIIYLVIVLISRSITRPMRKLTTAADKFAEGDFNVKLPVIKSKDEIGRLNTSFISMQNALSSTINDLKEASNKLKISNEKLEEYSRTLEQKVDARTSELKEKNNELSSAIDELKATQTRLVQSEKMASLGQLTAGIAHEIKNPLNFVNNFAELTADLAKELTQELDKFSDKLQVEDSKYLHEISNDIRSNALKINEHGKRADSIVRGMLLHSRGKAGDKQLSDVNAVLAEYVNLGYHGMRAQDTSFNIKIEANYDSSIGMINIVPQDISRVFLNIINNACYSTHQKKKELKDAYFPVLNVQTKNLGNKVEIKIRDNGTGIPQEIMDKVFNPFFTTKPAGQGTGLGLSLSYDIIVQEHRGEMKVVSEEYEFAEFIITIPKT